MMDTSEQYIKQCDRAEEIQENYRNRTTDGHDFIFTPPAPKLRIWLPRQDQLQEIVYPEEKSFAKLERIWNWWIKTENLGYCQSLEQLWLAFVMKEKFGKRWDNQNKEWRKE